MDLINHAKSEKADGKSIKNALFYMCGCLCVSIPISRIIQGETKHKIKKLRKVTHLGLLEFGSLSEYH